MTSDVLGINNPGKGSASFIFRRRISLGHREESCAASGKCNVDKSLCDRCQDADQRRRFTWMEYWESSDSYCDPLVVGQGLGISIQQHFVKSCIQKYSELPTSFRVSTIKFSLQPRLFWASLFRPNLCRGQFIIKVCAVSRGTFVKGAHSNLDSHHRDCQEPKWPWGHRDWARQCWVPRVKLSSNSNTTTINSGHSTANCNQKVFLSLIRSCPQIRRSEIEITCC